MSYLVLIRHGKSEWNTLGKWTGWTDIHLAEEGRVEARIAGEALKDIAFQQGFTSKLVRAKETLEEVKKVLGQNDLPVIEDVALNERDYGDFTGKNKWEVQKAVGEEEFQKIRRGWDYQLPNGESLKNVYERVVPYYEKEILPLIKENKNIIIAAHGNSLRALVKYLENISDEDITKLEIGTGEAYVYKLDDAGRVAEKEIRSSNPNKGKV
jgi:2,3-bisphosphoglycerate-dependent phosphoglycerate mutase